MLGIWPSVLLAAAAAAPLSLPDLALRDLQGKERPLSVWHDGKPMLLDFWATWCVPCRAAFPHYAQLAERYAEHGFHVVTVSADRPAQQKRIAPLLEKLGVDFVVLLDPEGELGDAMGVLSLPTAFLIDAQGRIAYRHSGYLPGDERAVEEQLRALLQLPAQAGDAGELAGPKSPR
jgi:thiol-disulfide isomerase/thioredoxin